MDYWDAVQQTEDDFREITETDLEDDSDALRLELDEMEKQDEADAEYWDDWFSCCRGKDPNCPHSRSTPPRTREVW